MLSVDDFVVEPANPSPLEDVSQQSTPPAKTSLRAPPGSRHTIPIIIDDGKSLFKGAESLYESRFFICQTDANRAISPTDEFFGLLGVPPSTGTSDPVARAPNSPARDKSKGK